MTLNMGTHKKFRLVKLSINIPFAIQIGKWISRNMTALIIIGSHFLFSLTETFNSQPRKTISSVIPTKRTSIKSLQLKLSLTANPPLRIKAPMIK